MGAPSLDDGTNIELAEAKSKISFICGLFLTSYQTKNSFSYLISNISLNFHSEETKSVTYVLFNSIQHRNSK